MRFNQLQHGTAGDNRTHYKLYKRGKFMCNSAIATFGVMAGLLTFNLNGKADVNPSENPSSDAATEHQTATNATETGNVAKLKSTPVSTTATDTPKVTTDASKTSQPVTAGAKPANSGDADPTPAEPAAAETPVSSENTATKPTTPAAATETAQPTTPAAATETTQPTTPTVKVTATTLNQRQATSRIRPMMVTARMAVPEVASVTDEPTVVTPTKVITAPTTAATTAPQTPTVDPTTDNKTIVTAKYTGTNWESLPTYNQGLLINPTGTDTAGAGLINYNSLAKSPDDNVVITSGYWTTGDAYMFGATKDGQTMMIYTVDANNNVTATKQIANIGTTGFDPNWTLSDSNGKFSFQPVTQNGQSTYELIYTGVDGTDAINTPQTAKNVAITYTDANGKTLASSDSVSGLVGQAVTVTPKTISGYHLIGTPFGVGNSQYILTGVKAPVVSDEYTASTSTKYPGVTLYTRYTDTAGDEQAYITYQFKDGSLYTSKPVTMHASLGAIYDFGIQHKFADQPIDSVSYMGPLATGEPLQFIYEADPTSTVTIHFVDKDSGKKLADPWIATGTPGSTYGAYDIKTPVFEHYTTTTTEVNGVLTAAPTDITVEYTSTLKTVTLRWWDDSDKTDDNKSTELDQSSQTVDFGSDVDFNYQTLLAGYLKKGFALVSSDINDAQPIITVTATSPEMYDVHLEHTFVTTDADHVFTKGSPMHPDDPDSVLYPDFDVTRTVTQTIEYRYLDDSTAATTYKAHLNFQRSGKIDLVTGVVSDKADWVSTNGKSTFEKVDSPAVPKYWAKPAEIEAISDVTADTVLRPRTVYYYPDEEVTVTFTDDTTGQPLTDLTATLMLGDGEVSDYRTTATKTTLTNQGYRIVSDDFPADGVSYGDKQPQLRSFNVHVVHATTPVSATQPGDSTKAINATDPDGVKFPVESEQGALVKKITRTIHYQKTVGTKVLPDAIETVEFDRPATVHNVTGKLIETATEDY